MKSTLNWSNLTAPASWKQNGRELRGPCPVTGEGATKAWAVPDDDFIGCRLCGDGSGRMDGATFREHAAALGLIDVNLGAAGPGKWESWIWTTADERERRQYRTPDGKKWHAKDPPAGGWPRPAELMYLPAGSVPTTGGPIYICEGASDAAAAHAAGLPAIGRTNARPSPESLGRLDKSAVYRLWPDVDDDGAGFKQAMMFADAATAAGLTVELIDPLALRPDAPAGFDARDFLKQPPPDVQAALSSAVVDAETIRARIPVPAREQPVSPVYGDVSNDADDVLPVPRCKVELCANEEMAAKAIARQAAGKLAYIHQTGEWLAFGPQGWQPVHRTAIEEAGADFAQWNIGAKDKKTGEVVYPRRTTGRKSVGRAITQLLESMVGTEFADWDATGSLIMLPDGALLDVFTGKQRPAVPADRIRRRVPVAPASEDDYGRSVFRYVLESLIPDAVEREYFQRRLGAALVNAEGLHDLIWLFGPPGAGKGTLLEALRLTFGDYGRGVPAAELIKGRPHDGHSAWKARLAGARVLFADDVPTGNQLEDTTINALLGSVITARHMRQASFDFRLHAPLIVTSNGEPRQATSNVRRLKPIECAPAASEDPRVQAAMSTPAERAACLRWLCVGAFRFARVSCPVPETIRARARDVAADAPVVVFTESFAAGGRYPSGDVWANWQGFAQANRCAGLAPSQTALGTLLRAHGWRSKRSHGIHYLTAPKPARVPVGAGSLIDSHREVDKSRASIISVPAPTGTPPRQPTGSEPDFPAGQLGRADGGAIENSAGAPPAAPAENPQPPPPPPAGETDDAAVTVTAPAVEATAPAVEATAPADEDAAPVEETAPAPILWRPDWKPHMRRADPSTPGTCAYCPAPLADGYPFTACVPCCRVVQAHVNGETATGPDGKPVNPPRPIAEPVRRAWYVRADPRHLAAVVAGRMPTADELCEWMGLESAS